MKKDFNDIIFEHKEFNFNFSITFDDIYIQKDKFIFIRIIFEDFHGASWVLGSPFMSKYLFTFNSDSKEIGFYSKNINDKIEIVDKKSNFSFSIFIEKDGHFTHLFPTLICFLGHFLIHVLLYNLI